ncbi:hypothetical protein [Aminobacter carboxidus]|uniref:Uncharacterized protein n=1 Tax=Aminobacter carboxidus TaxID=376165 RepID=A0A8E1WDJ1_9HYPH|nr:MULTISPECIES: hypothetical protein [Aminobacter carboxidus group]MBB6465462.1 hypothetical protein [Aminobacter lissarensis]MBE1204728.1 hypothetical protein [Aminobacter carboxidus]
MAASLRSPILPLVALSVLLVCADARAQAIEPGKEGELANLIPPEAGARACFGRVYDEAHLKTHPRQQVTEMQFRLAYYIHDPDAFFPKGQRNYYFEVLARLRGHKQPKPFSAMGECGLRDDGKSIFCGVDCDGGGVMVKRNGDGKIMLDLEALGRLRMTSDCGEGEEGGIELSSGADDKRFLLSKLPASECPAYDDW